MPTERIVMHRIKELLRLKYECGLSFERIARALKISKGVVAKYVKAAEVAGLDWPQVREGAVYNWNTCSRKHDYEKIFTL